MPSGSSDVSTWTSSPWPFRMLTTCPDPREVSQLIWTNKRGPLSPTGHCCSFGSSFSSELRKPIVGQRRSGRWRRRGVAANLQPIPRDFPARQCVIELLPVVAQSMDQEFPCTFVT